MNQLKYVMLMYQLQGFIHFQQKLDVQLFIGLKVKVWSNSNRRGEAVFVTSG